MKGTLKNLKVIYDYGKEYKKNFIIFSVFSLLFIFINVIYPILTARQLTSLTGGIFDELIWASIVILIFDILTLIRMWIVRRNTQIYFRGVFKKLQLAVSKEILRITSKDLDEHSSGVFIERLNADCSELSRIFTQGINYLTGILSDVGIFLAVFIISPYLFLYYFLASMVVTWLHLKKVREVSKKDKILRNANEKNIGLTSELVRGVKDIKMLNASIPFMREVDKSITDVTNSQFSMRNKEMNYTFLIGLVTAFINLGLIFILIFFIKFQGMTLAVAVVLFSYRDNIISNLMEKVGDLLTILKSFNLSSNRVLSLLGDDEFAKENFGNVHLDCFKGNFEFKNVTFGYYKNKPVLKDMSFKVNHHETVAFVGKSGAGKSTIFSLLVKLYPVSDGSILLDGVNINDLDEDSIRGNITVISQNPYIFNMSVRDNLKLVKADLTDEEMVSALKKACLNDFVLSLPNGYDTVVGEGGVTLSGGQKQRLAIARAFIQKTEIILFDEATSALDNETQRNIQKAIFNLQKDYTVLIIAHRLSTIINCDRIYFIQDGKVLASGTHNDLLKNCSDYQHLYENELISNTK